MIDADTGAALGDIDTERGKRYDVDPIADIGPHNTWMDPAGKRVYMEVLTVPYIYVADARTNAVLGKIGPFGKGFARSPSPTMSGFSTRASTGCSASRSPRSRRIFAAAG